MVGRYLTVECSGFAPDGTPLRLQARGWQARILQHEVRAALASHVTPTDLPKNLSQQLGMTGRHALYASYASCMSVLARLA